MTRSRVLAFCVACALGTAAYAAPAPPPAADGAAALIARLAGEPDPFRQAAVVARIVLVERPGGALQRAAEARMRTELGNAARELMPIFEKGDALAQVGVMAVYREHYPDLQHGFDPRLISVCREGTESPEPAVRAATMLMLARWPVGRIANIAIDAAVADPSLTLAALEAIESSADGLGTRWVVAQLGHRDPAVRAAAQRALAAIDRRAAELLRAAASGDDPAVARQAIEAFLLLAKPDDLPFLSSWLEKNAKGEAALVASVQHVVAQVEAGRYSPELPAKPPLAALEQLVEKRTKELSRGARSASR